MNSLPTRLYAYIALTAVLAVAAAIVATAVGGGSLSDPWDWYIAAILAPVVAVCVRFPLHVAPKVQQDMGAAPIMAAIILLPAPFAIGACLFGVLAGEWHRANRRPAQVTFNTALAVLAIACARMTADLAGAGGAPAEGLAQLALPALVYFGLSGLVTEGIVAVQLKALPFRGWWERAAEGSRHEAALLVLGLLAGAVGETEPWALPLVGIPCAVLYRSLHYQHVRLTRSEAGRVLAEDERSRLIAIIEVTPDFVATAEPGGRVLYLNEAGRRMLDIATDARLDEVSLDEAFSAWPETVAQAVANGQWTGEAHVIADAAPIAVSQVVLAHRGGAGEVEFLSTVARDITDRRSMEHQLQHLAHHDGLTGLLNRRGFDDFLRMAVDGAAIEGSAVAVTVLDLDGFKLVNDTFGHEAGDRVLTEVASALRLAVAPHGGSIARLGGDEFAIVLAGVTAAVAREVTESVVRAISAVEVAVGRERAKVGVSAGIAVLAGARATSGDLVRLADAAMYEAKRQRRGVVESAAA